MFAAKKAQAETKVENSKINQAMNIFIEGIQARENKRKEFSQQVGFALSIDPDYEDTDYQTDLKWLNRFESQIGYLTTVRDIAIVKSNITPSFSLIAYLKETQQELSDPKIKFDFDAANAKEFLDAIIEQAQQLEQNHTPPVQRQQSPIQPVVQDEKNYKERINQKMLTIIKSQYSQDTEASTSAMQLLHTIASDTPRSHSMYLKSQELKDKIKLLNTIFVTLGKFLENEIKSAELRDKKNYLTALEAEIKHLQKQYTYKPSSRATISSEFISLNDDKSENDEKLTESSDSLFTVRLF